MLSPVDLACLLLRVFFRLVDQLLQGRVDRFLSGAADPFVTDDSLYGHFAAGSSSTDLWLPRVSDKSEPAFPSLN